MNVNENSLIKNLEAMKSKLEANNDLDEDDEMTIAILIAHLEEVRDGDTQTDEAVDLVLNKEVQIPLLKKEIKNIKTGVLNIEKALKDYNGFCKKENELTFDEFNKLYNLVEKYCKMCSSTQR